METAEKIHFGFCMMPLKPEARIFGFLREVFPRFVPYKRSAKYVAERPNAD